MIANMINGVIRVMMIYATQSVLFSYARIGLTDFFVILILARRTGFRRCLCARAEYPIERLQHIEINIEYHIIRDASVIGDLARFNTVSM